MPDPEELDETEQTGDFYDPGDKAFINDVDHADDGDEQRSSVIDAEFSEERRPVFDSPIDDRGAIDAEVVSQESKGTGDPDLDKFLEQVPASVEVQIIINRKPDLNLKFRVPNQIDGHVETRLWQRENLDDVYSEIQRVHGGGRYRFQLRVGAGGGRKGGFNKSWEKTLFDPPEASVREKMAQDEKAKEDEQSRKHEPSPQFANPQPAAPPDEDELLEKFLEKLERYTVLVDRFRGPQAAPIEHGLSVKDQIILEAIKKAPDQDQLNSDVVRKAMSLVDKEERTWIDLVMYGLDHGDQLLNTIGKAMNMFGPMLFGRPVPPGMTMLPGQFRPPGPAMPTSQPAAEPAPQTGLQMPDEAKPPAVEPEKQPQGQQTASAGLKRVEW